MRLRSGWSSFLFVAATVVVAACSSAVKGGPIEEAALPTPTITGFDTASPPHFAWVQLQQPSYVALLLVTPSHTGVLLYPQDSTTSNQLDAGAHRLTFEYPMRMRGDTALLRRFRGGDSTRMRAARAMRRAPPSRMTPMSETYLLLLTSAQPLQYDRIIRKTAGVTIPSYEREAINAVAKAVKSTLPTEPRALSGYYTQVQIRP